MSESAHSSDPGTSRPDGKRTKLENPVATLLQGLRRKDDRSRHLTLQKLLFLIDRHWMTIHLELQKEVIDTLLQLVTADDVMIQNWVFCCFAAIVFVDSTPSSDTSVNWDGIWSHAVRRTNVPLISRTACHSALMLLLSAKVPQIRVHAEIGAIIQDINVQGPPAPYDSVCAFLARCVEIAAHDTRLYRMHLDDKILSWFIESWSIASKVSRISTNVKQSHLDQYSLSDLLLLLERACGFDTGSSIHCQIHLPRHPLVDFIQGQIDYEVMREFILNSCFSNEEKKSGCRANEPERKLSQLSGELVQPDLRVRKVSAFLLKGIEGILADWHNNIDDNSRPSTDSIRHLLDVAVLAICYESLLLLNGISNNRRAVIAACKLISAVSARLRDWFWTPEELAVLLSSLSPLVLRDISVSEPGKWEAFVEPGPYTGVRSGEVKKKGPADDNNQSHNAITNGLQKIIWQSADVSGISSGARSLSS